MSLKRKNSKEKGIPSEYSRLLEQSESDTSNPESKSAGAGAMPASRTYELDSVKTESEPHRDHATSSESSDSGTDNNGYVQSTDTFASTGVLIDDKHREAVAEQEEYDSDLSDDEGNCCTDGVKKGTEKLASWYKANSTPISYVVGISLLLLWVAYFIGAMYYSFEDGFNPQDEPAIRLIAINVIAVFCVTYWAVKKYYGRRIWKNCLKPCTTSISSFLDDNWHIIRWLVGLGVVAVIALIMGLDVGMKAPRNLISLIGMTVYISLFYIFSKHPAKVNWRPVIWGLVLQFAFAYLILRTCFGFLLFQWLGNRVQEFLTHTDAGSKFVFGEKYDVHFFAFKVLPVVVFFSTAISMLYFLGVMQVVIEKVAWLMQSCMGTTAGESLNAAGNIFVGQTEAPLLIKPLLSDMTKSEMHAVMTGGFATIAGSVLATYILFGVPANHLLSASVMSAPAALAMSKLFYPETKKSKTTAKDMASMERPPEKNLIEAASAGASASIKLVANIAANLIAFLALLQFVNETLKWFGARVGLHPPDYPDFTFEFICSYLLWPFAWVMGTPVEDCKQVATLIGIKTFTNEFIAYRRLADLSANRITIASWELQENSTMAFDSAKNCMQVSNSTYTDCLEQISDRGEVIAIYALCGFANLGSIGIMLGGLGAMAPHRKRDLAKIVIRAMIAGNVACFMTACIAGLLTLPDALNTDTC